MLRAALLQVIKILIIFDVLGRRQLRVTSDESLRANVTLDVPTRNTEEDSRDVQKRDTCLLPFLVTEGAGQGGRPVL